MKALFVAVSQNAKTGSIPATITERGSCWSGCALYDKGCYAFYGALAHFWTGVSQGSRGGSWDELCAKVAALPRRTLWRYAQAGDLPGRGATIDTELLSRLVHANRGKRAIAFTHKPVLPGTKIEATNRSAVAAANRLGFTVNLSANNPAQADALAELKIGPVVTILAHDYARRAMRHRSKARPDEWSETIAEWRDRIAPLQRRTPRGRRIAVCPATYSRATCQSCGACAMQREAVIGFPAHGAWRMVERATAARDVMPGESWAFHEHRTMAEVIADERLVTARHTTSPCRSARPAGFLRLRRLAQMLYSSSDDERFQQGRQMYIAGPSCPGRGLIIIGLRSRPHSGRSLHVDISTA